MYSKTCKNCGGECKLISEDSKSWVVRCQFCENQFTYNKETAPAPTASSSAGAPKAAAVDTGESVFDKCIDSVIELSCRAGRNGYAGSGFIISSSGYAITNTHVVTENSKEVDEVKAYVCGKTVPAQIVALGDNQGGHGGGEDLALIKLSNLPAKAKPVKFSANPVRNGQTLYVIGNSLGMGTCITKGIVSDKCREIGGKERMMTDCAVNHGNSGGPVFDEKGEVIGVIVSGIDSAEGMNFAIPLKNVENFIALCKKLVPGIKL